MAPIYFFVSIVSFVWRVRRRLFYVLFAFSSDFFFGHSLWTAILVISISGVAGRPYEAASSMCPTHKEEEQKEILS